MPGDPVGPWPRSTTHLARADLAAADRVQRLRRGVEDDGRAGEVEAAVVGHGQLDDAAVRGQAAADQHDRGAVPERALRRADDVLVGRR